MKAGQKLKPHIDALDGIRGLAVLAVMVFHARLFPIELKITGSRLPLWLDDILKHGGFGVDLFFVLSGFLITGILIASKTKPGFFRTFYARRTLRIFPLYYGVLLFWAVVFHFWREPLLTMGQANFWPWVLTFTTNLLIMREHQFAALPKALHHFWTLAIEEQFYLIWPALVYLTSRKALLLCSLFFIVLAPTLRYYLGLGGWIEAYMFTFARFDGLAAGALLALWIDRLSQRTSLLILLSGFVMLLTTTYAVFGETGFLEDSAMNLLALGLIASSLKLQFFKNLFSQRGITYLGRRSYGLYVIHQPLTVAAMLLPMCQGWAAWAYLPIPFLSLPLAELSWRFLEQPLLNLKARFNYSDLHGKMSLW